MLSVLIFFLHFYKTSICSIQKYYFIEVKMEHCLWIKLKYLKPIQCIPGIKQSEKAKYFLFIFQIGWSIVFQEKGPQPF